MSEKEIKTIFLRSIYEAAIEILGTSDSVQIFSTIINWDGSGEPPDIKNKPEFLSDLGNEFAIRFQRNTAKGLLLRIGDSSFTFLRRNLMKLVELGSIENRLKPISKRFDHSLGVLAEDLSALTELEIKSDVLETLRWQWTAQIFPSMAKLILGMMIRVCIALVIIASADAAFQKWKHIHDLKMTKQEIKDELKDTEGSPEIKKRILQTQLKMALNRMRQEVPKADVILVNPTHVAVALKYDGKAMASPTVVAKGADYVAEKIREIARAYGVPIIRRPELARNLYKNVKVGEPIPQTLYVAVAEVLALIYRLKHRGQISK